MSRRVSWTAFRRLDQRPQLLDLIPESLISRYEASDASLAKCIRAVNALIRDSGLAWYCELLTEAYFGGADEFKAYKRRIFPNLPIDLGTVRRRILERKYSCAKNLISDVTHTFSNAMRANVATSTWYKEANRGLVIFESLVACERVPTHFFPAQEALDAGYRLCPDCRNYLSPNLSFSVTKRQMKKASQNSSSDLSVIKCAKCKHCVDTTDSGEVFACQNHVEGWRFLCDECCIRTCAICWQTGEYSADEGWTVCPSKCWHNSEKCPKRRKARGSTRKKSLKAKATTTSKKKKKKKKRTKSSSSVSSSSASSSSLSSTQSTASSSKRFSKMESTVRRMAIRKAMVRPLSAAVSKVVHDRNSRYYRMPVAKGSLSGYELTVKLPMDLSTVSDNIVKDKYACVGDVKRDMEQIWTNSLQYNGQLSQAYTQALDCAKVFNSDWQNIVVDFYKRFAVGSKLTKAKTKATAEKRSTSSSSPKKKRRSSEAQTSALSTHSTAKKKTKAKTATAKTLTKALTKATAKAPSKALTKALTKTLTKTLTKASTKLSTKAPTKATTKAPTTTARILAAKTVTKARTKASVAMEKAKAKALKRGQSVGQLAGKQQMGQSAKEVAKRTRARLKAKKLAAACKAQTVDDSDSEPSSVSESESDSEESDYGSTATTRKRKRVAALESASPHSNSSGGMPPAKRVKTMIVSQSVGAKADIIYSLPVGSGIVQMPVSSQQLAAARMMQLQRMGFVPRAMAAATTGLGPMHASQSAAAMAMMCAPRSTHAISGSPENVLKEVCAYGENVYLQTLTDECVKQLSNTVSTDYGTIQKAAMHSAELTYGGMLATVADTKWFEHLDSFLNLFAMKRPIHNGFFDEKRRRFAEYLMLVSTEASEMAPAQMDTDMLRAVVRFLHCVEKVTADLDVDFLRWQKNVIQMSTMVLPNEKQRLPFIKCFFSDAKADARSGWKLPAELYIDTVSNQYSAIFQSNVPPLNDANDSTVLYHFVNDLRRAWIQPMIYAPPNVVQKAQKLRAFCRFILAVLTPNDLFSALRPPDEMVTVSQADFAAARYSQQVAEQFAAAKLKGHRNFDDEIMSESEERKKHHSLLEKEWSLVEYSADEGKSEEPVATDKAVLSEGVCEQKKEQSFETVVIGSESQSEKDKSSALLISAESSSKKQTLLFAPTSSSSWFKAKEVPTVTETKSSESVSSKSVSVVSVASSREPQSAMSETTDASKRKKKRKLKIKLGSKSSAKTETKSASSVSASIASIASSQSQQTTEPLLVSSASSSRTRKKAPTVLQTSKVATTKKKPTATPKKDSAKRTPRLKLTSGGKSRAAPKRKALTLAEKLGAEELVARNNARKRQRIEKQREMAKNAQLALRPPVVKKSAAPLSRGAALARAQLDAPPSPVIKRSVAVPPPVRGKRVDERKKFRLKAPGKAKAKAKGKGISLRIKAESGGGKLKATTTTAAATKSKRRVLPSITADKYQSVEQSPPAPVVFLSGVVSKNIPTPILTDAKQTPDLLRLAEGRHCGPLPIDVKLLPRIIAGESLSEEQLQRARNQVSLAPLSTKSVERTKGKTETAAAVVVASNVATVVVEKKGKEQTEEKVEMEEKLEVTTSVSAVSPARRRLPEVPRTAEAMEGMMQKWAERRDALFDERRVAGDFENRSAICERIMRRLFLECERDCEAFTSKETVRIIFKRMNLPPPKVESLRGILRLVTLKTQSALPFSLPKVIDSLLGPVLRGLPPTDALFQVAFSLRHRFEELFLAALSSDAQWTLCRLSDSIEKQKKDDEKSSSIVGINSEEKVEISDANDGDVELVIGSQVFSGIQNTKAQTVEDYFKLRTVALPPKECEVSGGEHVFNRQFWEALLRDIEAMDKQRFFFDQFDRHFTKGLLQQMCGEVSVCGDSVYDASAAEASCTEASSAGARDASVPTAACNPVGGGRIVSFAEIRQKIRNGFYTSHEQTVADLKIVFHRCVEGLLCDYTILKEEFEQKATAPGTAATAQQIQDVDASAAQISDMLSTYRNILCEMERVVANRCAEVCKVLPTLAEAREAHSEEQRESETKWDAFAGRCLQPSAADFQREFAKCQEKHPFAGAKKCAKLSRRALFKREARYLDELRSTATLPMAKMAKFGEDWLRRYGMCFTQSDVRKKVYELTANNALIFHTQMVRNFKLKVVKNLKEEYRKLRRSGRGLVLFKVGLPPIPPFTLRMRQARAGRKQKSKSKGKSKGRSKAKTYEKFPLPKTVSIAAFLRSTIVVTLKEGSVKLLLVLWKGDELPTWELVQDMAEHFPAETQHFLRKCRMPLADDMMWPTLHKMEIRPVLRNTESLSLLPRRIVPSDAPGFGPNACDVLPAATLCERDKEHATALKKGSCEAHEQINGLQPKATDVFGEDICQFVESPLDKKGRDLRRKHASKMKSAAKKRKTLEMDNDWAAVCGHIRKRQRGQPVDASFKLPKLRFDIHRFRRVEFPATDDGDATG